MAGASRKILERLLEEWIQPGADRVALEASIREHFEETWSVVFTDLVGFSRMTQEFGIVHFLSVIFRKRKLLTPVVEANGGLILKEEADSWLILFRRPQAALRALIEAQWVCAEHNVGLPPEEQVLLCAGIGHGPLLRIGDEDVWGREVNFASKLGEDVARGGEILVTEAAREALAEHEAALASTLDLSRGLGFERRVEHFSTWSLPHYRVSYPATRPLDPPGDPPVDGAGQSG
jgi:class 3 adenylate cyclase